MKTHHSIETLNRQLARFSRQSVVFTNGVFDLIHPGHIDLLEFAKQQGDILVVGINDDASVKRLKGDLRPVFPLAERMEILAAIEFVDFVVPFAQNTPLELIKSLSRIDVLVKGGDYKPHQVVGREEVEGSGGRLCLFQIHTDYSTTSIIRNIKEKS